MRTFILATVSAVSMTAGNALYVNRAQAVPMFNGLQDAAPASNIENVQFFFGGRRYCWYPAGWQGPGWYWCGYARRRGFGWGGGHGWHGWSSPGRVGGQGGRHSGGGGPNDGGVGAAGVGGQGGRHGGGGGPNDGGVGKIAYLLNSSLIGLHIH
jgi:hypothetical protein